MLTEPFDKFKFLCEFLEMIYDYWIIGCIGDDKNSLRSLTVLLGKHEFYKPDPSNSNIKTNVAITPPVMIPSLFLGILRFRKPVSEHKWNKGTVWGLGGREPGRERGTQITFLQAEPKLREGLLVVQGRGENKQTLTLTNITLYNRLWHYVVTWVVDRDCTSKQSKRRDVHLQWLHRETNDNKPYITVFTTTMKKHNPFIDTKHILWWFNKV